MGLQVFCADLLYFSNPSYFFEILFHFNKTLYMIILQGTVHRDSIKNLFIKISQNSHEKACLKASFCRKSISQKTSGDCLFNFLELQMTPAYFCKRRDEDFPGPPQISKMESFSTIVNGLQSLAIAVKLFILDADKGPATYLFVSLLIPKYL